MITPKEERQLDSTLKINRPQYISAQKISTLFDALDEREIARYFLRCASIHGRAGFILLRIVPNGTFST